MAEVTEREPVSKTASLLDPKISFAVSAKGAVSVYGMGRFPITLYKSQWDRLYELEDEIVEFIAEHVGELSEKAEPMAKGQQDGIKFDAALQNIVAKALAKATADGDSAKLMEFGIIKATAEATGGRVTLAQAKTILNHGLN